MIAAENILSLIPQRPPFVMVDKLLYADETTATTSFLINEKNIFVVNGKFTEPGLVENMAQTAAAQAGHFGSSSTQKKIPQIGYIGDVKNLEIVELPETGDELETEIIIVNHIFEVTMITCKIMRKKKLIASCEMKIFISQPK
jgi:3-hydroxymyristoyl/3-hydroxydecanoyl-(acyl carrier protein) dehydratase